MKKFNIILLLLLLGMVFAFSPIMFNNNHKLYEGYNDDIDVDYENVNLSKVSGKIHINNNWTDAWDAGICTGNGTYSDPYVIEDLEIDGEGSGSCIYIENSDVYFKIENCTVYNSSNDDAGIKLHKVSNGLVINNNVSNNYIGVIIRFSNYTTISGNTANNNSDIGINLIDSDYNTVSGNIANNNTKIGILSSRCNNNTISENTANNNGYGYHDHNSAYGGIFLYRCNNNTVFGNTANNNSYGYSIADSGIILSQSNDNTIIGNTANYNSLGIFLVDSNYNTVSGNTANNNRDGILLYRSTYNIISGNTLLGNKKCIGEIDCQGNEFSDNGSCTYGEVDKEPAILGYNLFFLLGILSVAVILISKKLKKS